MMRYLLDTNVLSEPLKPIPHPGVMSKLSEYRKMLTTAAPVWHELQYGFHRLPPSRKKTMVEKYLREVIISIVILPYDERAAEWHAQERARLESAGRTPPFSNGQIASIAKVNGLALVTRNGTDYEYFPGLDLENWH